MTVINPASLGTLGIFVSDEQTSLATSEVSIAHSLGRVPSVVVVIFTDITTADVATEGTHDATNVKVTVTSGAKYKVLAM